jgi:YfiH family protein
MGSHNLAWIVPDWPAPAGVRAGTTTRLGGYSLPPYESLNLGDHVGDNPEAVTANRALLRETLELPAEPLWLEQVHGIEVVDASQMPPLPQVGERGGVRGMNAFCPQADAAFTHAANVVCAVMTADCLPVLLCDEVGCVVAASHAGWRGLADGVIEATVGRMGISAGKLLAWLGPAIGPSAFEVGEEVRDRFLKLDAAAAEAFRPSPNGRWLADLYQLARLRLQRLGVERVYGGHWCTYRDPERFYSYRRDGITGRMASLIWLDASR